jgi:hypothetical protein
MKTYKIWEGVRFCDGERTNYVQFAGELLGESIQKDEDETHLFHFNVYKKEGGNIIVHIIVWDFDEVERGTFHEFSSLSEAAERGFWWLLWTNAGAENHTDVQAWRKAWYEKW